MKKIFLAIMAIMLVCTAACAEGANIKVGMLSKLNMTQEEYTKVIASAMEIGTWSIFSRKTPEPREIIFFDSLTAMQMALNAKTIDEIALPEVVSEYIMNVTNNKYIVSAIDKTKPAYFSFGFRKTDDQALLNKFNEALMSMKEDGTLSVIQAKYIYEPGIEPLEPAKFDKYENVDKTVKVAVTGDLPPIDYIAPDGTPAGFNTAVLAEIAKRLKVNVELVNIDSAARAAALASNRVDAVFWIQAYRNTKTNADMPDNITLSEPYYEWNEYLHLALGK